MLTGRAWARACMLEPLRCRRCSCCLRSAPGIVCSRLCGLAGQPRPWLGHCAAAAGSPCMQVGCLLWRKQLRGRCRAWLPAPWDSWLTQMRCRLGGSRCRLLTRIPRQVQPLHLWAGQLPSLVHAPAAVGLPCRLNALAAVSAWILRVRVQAAQFQHSPLWDDSRRSNSDVPGCRGGQAAFAARPHARRPARALHRDLPRDQPALRHRHGRHRQLHVCPAQEPGCANACWPALRLACQQHRLHAALPAAQCSHAASGKSSTAACPSRCRAAQRRQQGCASRPHAWGYTP